MNQSFKKSIVTMATLSAVLIGASSFSFAANKQTDNTNKASNTTDKKGTAGNRSANTLPVVVLLPIAVNRPFPNHSCWVQVFENDNFQGPSVVIEGPQQIANLDQLDSYRFFDSPGDSVIVGSGAKVVLYEDENYTGDTVTANANQRITDVSSRFGAFESMESAKIECSNTNRTG